MSEAEILVLPVHEAELHVRIHRPTGAVRAIVQIAHGMSEHSARYDRVAQKLVNAGYFVIASDHRGHGHTKTNHGVLGHFADRNGFPLVVEDLLSVRARAVSEVAAQVPVFLFGHSMGSFFGQWMMCHHGAEYAGFMLSGSDAPGGFLVAAGRQLAKLERARKGQRSTSRVLTFLSFGAFNKEFEPVRTEADWLSRDSVEVDKYVADPLCGFEVTTQLWVDLTSALMAIASRGFAQVADKSIHLFGGSLDPVGKNGKGLTRLFEMLGGVSNKKLSLQIYQGARHETLNETNREEVMQDVVERFNSWL